MAKQRTSKGSIVAQIAPARRRAERERKLGRRAVSATYEPATGRVMMELTNGFVFGFPVRSVPALAKAGPEDLAAVELSAGGSALHWEALDADLSVAGLLLASVGRLQKLTELARAAGRTRSAAKAAASRANGAKGGRPRK